MKRFLKSLLVAIFVAVVAFTPAFADTMCNLYNKADGVLYGYPTASITWSAGAGTGENSELTIRMRLTEGKTYTAIRAVAGGTPAFRIQASPTETLTNGQSLVNINSAGNTNTKTFVVPTGAPYVLFYVRNTYGGSNPVTKDEVINGFMVVEGSTAPTEYIPYKPLCATCDGTVEQSQWNQLMNGTKRASWVNWNNKISNIVNNAEDNSVSFDFSGGSVWNVANSHTNAPTISGHKYFVTTLVTTTTAVSLFDLAYVNADGGSSAGFKRVSLQANQQTRVSGIATAKGTGRGLGFEFKSVDPGHMTVKDFQIFDLTAMFGAGNELTTVEAAETAIAQRARELGISATNGYYEYHASENVSYCRHPIKIATTAYNSARFSPVVTELNDTIATIRDVVTNTINQTKAIADLQATKQTRPDSECPAGKKCLLVEDVNGVPHWYEIIEEYIPPE